MLISEKGTIEAVKQALYQYKIYLYCNLLQKMQFLGMKKDVLNRN